jgi:mannose-6-phosphate isomerase
MEPSDLVVRCEFEREGIVVPPAARFMQKDPAFALQIFDYEELSVSQVTERFRIMPRRITETEEQLIGPEQSGTFSVRRITARKPLSFHFVGLIRIGVVTRGVGSLTIGKQTMALFPGAKFLISAQAPEGTLRPERGKEIEVLICSP